MDFELTLFVYFLHPPLHLRKRKGLTQVRLKTWVHIKPKIYKGIGIQSQNLKEIVFFLFFSFSFYSMVSSKISDFSSCNLIIVNFYQRRKKQNDKMLFHKHKSIFKQDIDVV